VVGLSNAAPAFVGWPLTELEGSGFDPFTDAQYATLAALTRKLEAVYPIADIVGHSDIVPGRKTDPGPFFDWARYRRSHA
jgi:AmpD protein